MKRQISFKAALHTSYPKMDVTEIEVTGEEIAYGLVLHQAIGVEKHPKHWPTHYAVSEPETGLLICMGSNRMECISQLIQGASSLNRNYPGGFRAARERAVADFYRLRAEGIGVGFKRRES